jgi:hypothetical protein
MIATLAKTANDASPCFFEVIAVFARIVMRSVAP